MDFHRIIVAKNCVWHMFILRIISSYDKNSQDTVGVAIFICSMMKIRYFGIGIFLACYRR
jgi:hypothetical protein